MALGMHKSVEGGNEFTCIRNIGRTRVVISRIDGFSHSSPLKMQQYYRRRAHLEAPNRIESLPGDVLVRIVCGVDHSDLKQVFYVSKMFKEATLIAMKSHFAFCTPTTKPVFKEYDGFKDEIDTQEAPNAPKQSRIRKSRLADRDLGSIVVNLFAPEE